MALIERDLLGNETDKVKKAIDMLKMFERDDGYYVAYSGGKDSTVLLALVRMAGVKHDVHYAVTTVDPPELVRFIISQFDTVIYDMSDTPMRGHDKYFTTRVPGKLLSPITKEEIGGSIIYFSIPELPMRKLIVDRRIPPTRLARYCCEVLKETNGKYRVTVTGVRWAESRNRKENQGIVTIVESDGVSQIAEEQGANFTETVRGGVVLNLDNDAARRTVELCYRTRKTLINPIIDWTDEDVWEFIRKYNIPYCKLYDEGLKRLGCVGCPLGGRASQKREFERWPQYKKLYIQAFDEMLQKRIAEGKTNHTGLWTDGNGVFKWWIGDDRKNDPNQITIFDDLEES